MTYLESLVQAPPQEDSEDLSDEEIERAVPTTGYKDLAEHLKEELQREPGLTVKSHERRRRGESLYWRTRLVRGSEPDRILVYQANWLGG